MDKLKILLKYSNPEIAQQNAIKYLGKDALLYISTRKNKKYMIRDKNNKFIHFGSIEPPYEDFTKHRNEARRQNYLKRTVNIRGNWADNPYSSNNLSREILWSR